MINFTSLRTLAIGASLLAGVAVQAVADDNASAANFTTEPDWHSPLAQISGTVEVIFPDCEFLYFENGFSSSTKATVAAPDGSVTTYAVEYGSKDNSVVFNVSPALTAAGVYTVKFTNSDILDGNTDAKLGNVEFQYTVEGGSEVQLANVKATPDPSQPLESLSGKVLIQYVDHEAIYNAGGAFSPVYATVSTPDGRELKYETKDVWDPENAKEIDITEPLTAAGQYTIRIKGEDILDINTDQPVGDAVVVYTVKGASAAPYTLSPAAGAVTSLKEMTLAFPAAQTVAIANAEGATLTDAKGKATAVEMFKPEWAKGNEITLAPAEEITAAGTYTLAIASGSLTVDGEAFAEPISAVYTIEAGAEGYTAVITPAEGVVEKLEEFTLTFEGAARAAVRSDAAPKDYPYIAKVAADGTMTKLVQCYNSPANKANEVDFYIFNPITTVGEYAVVVPSTFLTVDGEAPATDLVFRYTIAGAELNYTYAFTPADGQTLSKVESFVIAFDGVKSIKRNTNSFSQPRLQRLAEDGTVAESLTMISRDETELSFSMTPYYPVTESGTYRLSIPANYITLTGADGTTAVNEEITATYTVDLASGIATLKTQDGRAAVYTIGGVRLDKGAHGHGLYIVGGKKVVY